MNYLWFFEILWLSPKISPPMFLVSIDGTCINQSICWRWENCEFSICYFFHFFSFSLFAHSFPKEELPPPSFLNINMDHNFKKFQCFLSFWHRLITFEHALAVWHKMSRHHLLLSLSVMEPAMSIKSPGFFEWKVLLRNKGLSVRYANIIGSFPIQRWGKN